MLQGHILIRIKDGMKPYQASPRYVAYALQAPLRKDIERLNEQQIIE